MSDGDNICELDDNDKNDCERGDGGVWHVQVLACRRTAQSYLTVGAVPLGIILANQLSTNKQESY